MLAELRLRAHAAVVYPVSSRICRKLILCSRETEMTLRRIASFIFLGSLLVLITESVAPQNFAPLGALHKLNLPNQQGDVPVYYSACCKERAMQVQSTLTDCVHFYKEKLGIDRS